MSNEVQVKKLTDIMAQFVGFTAKKLPDDVIAKLQELRDKEDSPMTNVIYDTMFRNQELALKLNRPSCQDTGVLQFWVKCGTKFPLIDNLEALLKDAVMQATVATPLRHNSVETFDEYNTGKNVGKGTPTVWWDIVPNSDKCEIYTYMAGGGCTLPGNATVLMPGEGYEGVTKFVLLIDPAVELSIFCTGLLEKLIIQQLPFIKFVPYYLRLNFFYSLLWVDMVE